MNVRLQQIEEGGLPGASASGADPKTALELAKLQANVKRLDELQSTIQQRVEDLDKSRLENHRSNLSSIERVQKDMMNLAKYVTGGADAASDRPESRASKESQDEWPLAWLERRVEALIKKKGGGCLEPRLAALEKAATEAGSTGLGDRIKKVEQDIKTLDVKDLGKVRPDLTEHQRQSDVFQRDLLAEVNELKVVVGCVEACIPRETRKAVQLFKRAAGSTDVPASPREFAIESKILVLREEMQGQIQEATTSLEDARERMTAVVKALEKKQEILESRMEDVRRTTQSTS
jgi:hypothetical protein